MADIILHKIRFKNEITEEEIDYEPRLSRENIYRRLLKDGWKWNDKTQSYKP